MRGGCSQELHSLSSLQLLCAAAATLDGRFFLLQSSYKIKKPRIIITLFRKMTAKNYLHLLITDLI